MADLTNVINGKYFTPEKNGVRKQIHLETNTEVVFDKESGKNLKTILSEQEAVAKTYADSKITDLVGAAPETLDTIHELAEAVTNNQDAVTAINNAITNKAERNDVYVKSETYTQTEVNEAISTAVDAAKTEITSGTTNIVIGTEDATDNASLKAGDIYIQVVEEPTA